MEQSADPSREPALEDAEPVCLPNAPTQTLLPCRKDIKHNNHPTWRATQSVYLRVKGWHACHIVTQHLEATPHGTLPLSPLAPRRCLLVAVPTLMGMTARWVGKLPPLAATPMRREGQRAHRRAARSEPAETGTPAGQGPQPPRPPLAQQPCTDNRVAPVWTH